MSKEGADLGAAEAEHKEQRGEDVDPEVDHNHLRNKNMMNMKLVRTTSMKLMRTTDHGEDVDRLVAHLRVRVYSNQPNGAGDQPGDLEDDVDWGGIGSSVSKLLPHLEGRRRRHCRELLKEQGIVLQGPGSSRRRADREEAPVQCASNVDNLVIINIKNFHILLKGKSAGTTDKKKKFKFKLLMAA